MRKENQLGNTEDEQVWQNDEQMWLEDELVNLEGKQVGKQMRLEDDGEPRREAG